MIDFNEIYAKKDGPEGVASTQLTLTNSKDILLMADNHISCDIEIWKPIKGSNAEISNLGNIRNVKTKKHYAIHINHKGYLMVGLAIDGQSKNRRLHRLVASSFGLDTSKQIDHIDGNKANNKLCNLRPCSLQQNIHYYWSNPVGLQNITKTKSGSWKVVASGKHIGVYKKLSEAKIVRDKLYLERKTSK